MSASSQWAGLELRHLLALQAVAEQGSFHKAAAHLNYTQSGVSQQVAALERIVGEKLVERPGGSRPVRLTEPGEVVLRHAGEIFGQITAAQADVSALRNGAGGLLRVGAFQSVSAMLLPPLMKRLSSECPHLRIELTQTSADSELLVELEAGRLDITFVLLPVPEGPFTTLELFSEPFVVMAASDAACATRGGPISMAELSDLPLVAEYACRWIEDQMRERGFEPRVVHRSDDNGTMQGLVAAGAGVAVVARLVAQSANGGVALVDLQEQLPLRRVALAWRRDRDLPRSREAFVEAARETCVGLGLQLTRTDD